jgi:hypothetical protein
LLYDSREIAAFAARHCDQNRQLPRRGEAERTVVEHVTRHVLGSVQ